jgi:hypothetical protein
MINPQKLIEAAEHHIKRGDNMTMDQKVVRELALLAQAVRETLDENLHLADGKNCTLRTLRDAYLKIDPTWGQE